MACCLFSVKPLSAPMLIYCQLDPEEQISVTFNLKFKVFIQENSLEDAVCEIAAILSQPQSVDACNAILILMQYNSYDTIMTVESAWWMLMSWCLFGTRASATTMMMQTCWCISKYPNVISIGISPKSTTSPDHTTRPSPADIPSRLNNDLRCCITNMICKSGLSANYPCLSGRKSPRDCLVVIYSISTRRIIGKSSGWKGYLETMPVIKTEQDGTICGENIHD